MTGEAKIWLAIGGLAVATYLIRLSFLALLAGRRVPPALLRLLAYVPVTVLPALIAPMVLSSPAASGATDPARVAACAAAFVAGLAARNVLAAILSGIAGFAAIRLLGL